MKGFVYCLLIASLYASTEGKQLEPKQLEPKQPQINQPQPEQPQPKQPQPKFSWLSERSASGVPLLSIQHEDEVLVAVLSHYNPIPVELDENRAEPDPCIFKGFLQNEESAQVLVTGGCPGSDSFEVAMISKKYGGFRYTVTNGVGKPLRNPFGTPMKMSDGSQGIFRDRAVPSHQFQSMRNTSVDRVALPSQGFVFRLAIIYDKYWLAKYVDATESANAVRRVIANAQIIFNWPSLTVPIKLEVVSITFQNIAIPADVSGLDALVPFATDTTIGSYVGLTTFGSYGGIAYQPGVCGSMKYRTAVVKNGGYTDMTTAEIMAHELGHNLAMNHDFIDPYTSPKTIFRDASGNTCTDVNGVMDYYVTVQKWTTCSVERFTQHYNNVISSKGTFCMPLNTGGLTPVNGNWGAWTSFGTCSKTCASGTQTRTRLCNNPAPANGGAACVGSASESRACNTQACTAQTVALIGGPASNEGYLYATNPATGIYGPVCDDYFTITSANVVCKQLKFSGAASVACCSSKGAVPTNFSYDNVKCVGSETTLNACPHLNNHDCYSNEGLWIVCNKV